jgi:hypothetical protein
MSIENILHELKKPLPYQWKIQSFNKDATKASCVAYIDARDLMERLDFVLGCHWSCEYKQVGEVLYCGIGIFDGTQWIYRWDAGGKSDIEEEKGTASDAFKRAGVKWGVGRFLYDLEIKWIDIQNKKPIDKDGKIIYNLSEYFTKLQDKTPVKVIPVPHKEQGKAIVDIVKDEMNPDYDMRLKMFNHICRLVEEEKKYTYQDVKITIKLMAGKESKFMDLDSESAIKVYDKVIENIQNKFPETIKEV